MSTLTIISQALAYDDDGATSNPSQRPVDWKRTITKLPVNNPSTAKLTVEPSSAKTVFDGARSTSIDGTTTLSLASSSSEPGRYRITATSGTSPAFRTPRTVTASGISLALTIDQNLVLKVTAASGTPFAAILAGDTVFIPGTATGDAAGPFNSLNVGHWSVLTASATILTLTRASGTVFEGIGETVVPSANTQLQAFSTSGVQVGDTVELVSGFAATSLRAYTILAVNPLWIEIFSSSPLGSQVGIVPTATGFLVYTSTKRYIQIEVDQECVLRLNGDTGNTNRLSPWIPGDKAFQAEFKKTGPVWKLELVNKSNAPMSVLVISAE